MANKVPDILSRLSDSAEYTEIDLTDVNQRGGFGNTPLKVAVVRGDMEAVDVLVNAGADINAILEDGYTALHHAATQNHPEVAQLLLEHCALTEIRNDFGRTAKEEAVSRGHDEVARIIESYEK